MPRVLGIAFSVLIAACGGTVPVVVAPVVPEGPSGPALEALYLANGSLVHHDLAWDSRTQTGVRATSVRAVWPSMTEAAFVLGSADSTWLGFWGDAVRRVDAQPGNWVVTLDWAPDGSSLAYGRYRPVTRAGKPAMGEGDILWMDHNAPPTTVGCSASKAVLAWLADGALLVRNDANLYVVARDGCATIRSVDARRMHALTVSPDGARYAYVHRDLVYNRARRAYEPDSTMMLAETSGGEPRTVVGFKYAPRRFAWSPDGSELAFDVESQDEPGRRLITVFSVATGSTSYLHPPQLGGESEFEPTWSPSGSRMVFRQGSGWATRAFADPYVAPVAESDGYSIAGWAAEDVPVFRRPDGTYVVIDLVTGSAIALPSGIELVAVRPLPPRS